ncbi:formylglycine-generating enzyme family protein [Luteolibacter sp. Populi]|uniref:formylglycine-generating enzyme family protein n=1 Tax=Luteolibacter sp. Populi TaxID=3230487 RepID=UPI003467648C
MLSAPRFLVYLFFSWLWLQELHAAISIDTVLVDHPTSNVPYDYRIGTYEVTNSQYAAFLNAVATVDPHGLYHTAMASPTIVAQGGGIQRSGSSGSYRYTVTPGGGNYPVRIVSFYDAARFCNWLTNGQPVGPPDLNTTESGMYFLGGVSQPPNNQVVRLMNFNSGGNGVALPTRYEWYKAGHYDPSRGPLHQDYWLYATQSDEAPLAIGPNDTFANSANYDNGVGGLTPVGSYELAASYFGTYDQSGNVWEIFESFWDNGSGSNIRREGGGSYGAAAVHISTNYASSSFPYQEYTDMGFRIVSTAPIPEPGLAGYASAFACMLAFRRRRRASPKQPALPSGISGLES